MNESWLIWRHHVTHISLISVTEDRRLPRKLNGSFDCRMSHVRMNRHAYERIMSLFWMKHLAFENEECHLWISRIAHEQLMNTSCHSYLIAQDCRVSWMCRLTSEWVMSFVWTRHVTLVHASSQISMSHITHEVSCHSCEEVMSLMWSVMSLVWSVMSFVWRGHVTFVSCQLWMSHVTYSTLLKGRIIWTRNLTSERVKSLICTLRTTHLKMSHVTLMTESCHTYQWVMSHSYKILYYMNDHCHVSCMRGMSLENEADYAYE